MKPNRSFIIKLTGMALIILSQSACRTEKLLNRQQTSSSSLEVTADSVRELQNRSFSRTSAVRDSSDQFYQVTIFPADTFQFSMQEGFTGKATKLEVRGSIRQIRHLNDSATLMTGSDKRKTYKSIQKMDNEEVSKFKSVEKTRINWLLVVCLAAAFGVLTVWILRRYLYVIRW